jgi:hypothetical protein
MITAFILANNDAKAITRTLNALIGATVEGLVRELILVADINNETAAKIADYAGCGLVADSEFADAMKQAKGDWLLVLESGALPELGWAEAVSNHIQLENGAARFGRSPLAPRKLLQRLFQPEQPLALGLLIEKRVALSLGQTALRSPQQLAKAVKLKPLPAALRPASNVHPSAA